MRCPTAVADCASSTMRGSITPPTGRAATVGPLLSDWSAYIKDPDGSYTYNRRLVAAMGRPMEPGTYYVGVYNHAGAGEAAYTLLSRGIGVDGSGCACWKPSHWISRAAVPPSPAWPPRGTVLQGQRAGQHPQLAGETQPNDGRTSASRLQGHRAEYSMERICRCD